MGHCLSRIKIFFRNIINRIRKKTQRVDPKPDNIVTNPVILAENHDIIFHDDVDEKKTIEIVEKDNESLIDNEKDKESNSDCISEEKTEDKIRPLIENSERHADLSKLYENLKAIANVKESQKLWLENDTLKIDTNTFQRFYRWYSGQSRDTIIPFMTKVITNGSLEENIKYREIFDTFLTLGTGINNLKKVYIDKVVDLDRMNVIVTTTITNENN